jgi:hypothetical protein
MADHKQFAYISGQYNNFYGKQKAVTAASEYIMVFAISSAVT